MPRVHGGQRTLAFFSLEARALTFLCFGALPCASTASLSGATCAAQLPGKPLHSTASHRSQLSPAPSLALADLPEPHPSTSVVMSFLALLAS